MHDNSIHIYIYIFFYNLINISEQYSNDVFVKQRFNISKHISSHIKAYTSIYKAFRRIETLFAQGNIFVLLIVFVKKAVNNSYPLILLPNKPPCLVIKKEVNNSCFDSVRIYYLGRIKFLHVEMPYYTNSKYLGAWLPIFLYTLTH